MNSQRSTPARLRALVRFIVCVGSLVLPARLAAQDEGSDADGRRPVVTRAQLEQALAEAEQYANSSGYSSGFREGKRLEAGLIRERLQEGDFLVGDQIGVTMIGDSGFSGLKTVQPGRVLVLGTLPEIPMRGVLRSEVEAYLTEQIGRYVKNPQVKARPRIRLTMMGGVSHAGFFQMDADILLSDALELAGGINNSTELKQSKVMRGEEEIIPGDVFVKAINDGRTLDDLNLRAGDEIVVGQKSKTDWFTKLRTYAIIPGLIVSTYGLGKLFGIF